jgi:hypothetical protein
MRGRAGHRRKAAPRQHAHPWCERAHRRGGLRWRRHPAPIPAVTGGRRSEQRKGEKGENELGLRGSRLPPGFDPARKPNSRPIKTDGQERLGYFRPRRGLGGVALSRPRPRLRPGTRSAQCASRVRGLHSRWAARELGQAAEAGQAKEWAAVL